MDFSTYMCTTPVWVRLSLVSSGVVEESKANNVFVCSCRAQDVYTADPNPSRSEALQNYQAEIRSATTTFTALAQEMTKIMTLFKEHGLMAVADIVGRIQLEEKEKLQLVKLMHYCTSCCG